MCIYITTYVRVYGHVCEKEFFNEHECLAIIGGHTRIQIARLCEQRTRMQRSRSNVEIGFPDKVLRRWGDGRGGIRRGPPSDT